MSYSMNMKKNNLYSLIFICYEIARITVILTTRPEFSIEILPVSWYSSVPLLSFSLIFAYLMTAYDYPEKKIFSNLYQISKFFSNAGIVAFLAKAIPLSISYGTINDYYSLKRSIFLMIFLIIDAILCTVLFLKTKNPDNGEN